MWNSTVVLGNCAKGSRARLYDNEMRMARRAGIHLSEPRNVYDTIKSKMMRFRETDEEKGTRVMQEYNELSKG